LDPTTPRAGSIYKYKTFVGGWLFEPPVKCKHQDFISKVKFDVEHMEVPSKAVF
jgi:hypothetical protein